MNRDEQKQITELIERALKHVSLRRPATLDVEADAIIRALFVRNPEAAYRITMLAIEQSEEIKRLQLEIAEFSKASLLSRLFKPRRELRVSATVSDRKGQVPSAS